MKQIERDPDLGASVVRFEAAQKRGAGNDSAVVQNLATRVSELEQALWRAEQSRDDTLEKYRQLEIAVQTLAQKQALRQKETEDAILAVAGSYRDHFEAFHRFKGEVLGLAAHVDRWTKRVDKLLRTPPISWLRRLKGRS